MSWLRSALSKAAAEVGGTSRAVRSLYNQAAGSAKLVQDRLSGKNLHSFKDAIKRLNEVSLNARGAQRLQALARWLNALKELNRQTKQQIDPASPKSEEADDTATSPRKQYAALFYDSDNGGEALNFRDVFLRSSALEHIVTSMIYEPPQDDEVAVLLEMFGLCLSGGQELHKALVSSIQDLAKAFSTLQDEVEIKRGELLEMAQAAVSGLKLNSEVERLDAEVLYLQQKITERQGMIMLNDSNSNSDEPKLAEELLDCGTRIRNCLYKKKELVCTGDTADTRKEKVRKLKEVAERLLESVNDVESMAAENRQQKDKAITYRDTKALEVLEVEKTLAAEIDLLQKKKEQLESELKEVNGALSIAIARHVNTQEEKEQFDDASFKILMHLNAQSQEMARSVEARRAEASAAGTWAGFLEDTWLLQSSCLEHTTEQTKQDLEEAKRQFFSIATLNLSYYQEEMKLLLKHLKVFSNELDGSLEENNKFQSKYLETEKQFVDILKITDGLAEEVMSFGLETEENRSDLEKKVAKCLQDIDALKSEFRGASRPKITQEQQDEHGNQDSIQ